MTNADRSASPATRLRHARERAGYFSASEFARAANINYTTYAHHENGRREILPNAAKLYARLLNTPVGNLLYGDAMQNVPDVPVTACLSSQGRVKTIRTRNGKPQLVRFPDTSDMVGMEIIDDENYPAYREGDVVIHRALRTDNFDPERVSGLECIVRLADGTELLRHVTVQPNGRATLAGFHAAPMVNQEIVAAEPVEIVLRKVNRRLSNR